MARDVAGLADARDDELPGARGDQIDSGRKRFLYTGGGGKDGIRLSFQYCSGSGWVFYRSGHFSRATVAWQPAILVRLDRLSTPASHTANAPDTVACITPCIRHTDLPGTSKLFADLLYHFDRVSRFYAHDPSQMSAYDVAAKQIDYPLERRAAMAKALAGQNPPSELLTRFGQSGTVAVITGQQVGLFGGPA